MNTPDIDPEFVVHDFRPELRNVTVWHVPNRGRSARRLSMSGYAQTIANELGQLQEQLGEGCTVCIQLQDGQYFAHVGPMYYARHAALHRAGVRNLPTYGPNRH